MATDVDHPTIPWDQSAEKTIMIIALREGKIPLSAKKDQGGLRTTDLENVWNTYCPSYLENKAT
jgi:hypothetical protein